MGGLEGIKVCRRAPSITHLLFADDSLLSFRATTDQAMQVKQVLSTFKKCTGQLLSPSKCSMLVREGSDDARIQQVRDILGLE
jgi:hypothetical protein